MKMENFQKLLELKKELTGIDNLVIPGRVSVFEFLYCHNVFMVLKATFPWESLQAATVELFSNQA